MLAGGASTLPRASTGVVTAWSRISSAAGELDQGAPSHQAWTDGGTLPAGGGPSLYRDGPASSVLSSAGHPEGGQANITGGGGHKLLWSLYRSGEVHRNESVGSGLAVRGESDVQGGDRALGAGYSLTVGGVLGGAGGGVENVTSSVEESRGHGLLDILMGSTPPLPERNVTHRNSSVIKEALGFTLDAGGDALASPAATGPLQRFLLGRPDPVYLSALNDNLSVERPSFATLSNYTEPLFADYPPHLLDFAVFCCVLFIVLGVPGNLITIIALVKCKKVHNATGVFIINLTLSDLMFCVFNLPLAASLFGQCSWVHTGFVCLLFPILRYGLVAVSVFTVLAITINRYVMIAHPQLYNKVYTPAWLTVMVLSTWLGAFGALVPTLLELWGTFGLDPAIGSCTILPDRDGNSPKEFLFVFAFVLPCVAICVCYARIFFIVHRADKKSHSSGQRILKINGNGKRQKSLRLPSPYRGPSAPVTLHAVPLNDRLQRETLAKLSSSRNSVRVEIVEPEKEGREQPRPKEGSKLGLDGGGKAGRTPSPDITPGDAPTDACSLLRTEVNGFSGHTSKEGGAPHGVPYSPIRICPPSAPDSPVSERSEGKADGADDEEDRRASTISGKGNAFSQLRGTFRRPGSFISRQPNLSAKDRRLLKMILVIFMSFVACYLPITLVKTFSEDDNPVFNILGLLLIYLTTCINPIIYVVMSSEYRQAYVSLLTCRRDVDPNNRSVTKIS